jgi:O-antigen ligase
MILFPRDALTHSRVVHFAAAGVFALRYFTSYSRVRGFLKFSVFLMLIMFGLHILIRTGIYEAPIAETGRIVEIGGLVGERGTRALIPMLYLVMISLAIGRFSNRVGIFVVSIMLLLIGLGGIVLSETRSTYGAMVILVISALIFMRARIKNTIIFTSVAMFIVYAATIAGFDFLARFRTDYGHGHYALPSFHELRNNWRGIEYDTIASSYKQQPYFLLTGRGVGAMHPAPRGADPMVGFYHSEYLGWLDRCGLIGLFMVIVLILACLWRSFMLARSDIVYLRYIGTTSFLLIIALAADGVFHPIFSHYRGASILICFAAILANWRDIYMSLTEETQVCEEEIEEELIEDYDSNYGLPQIAY